VSSAFGYLTVLISIVLGLGVAHLLGSVARAVSRRSTTKFYWPTLVWAAVLFIMVIQIWWADFSLSDEAHWTLAGFVSTLLIPATLYFMAFLLMPESNDMHETYFRNRVLFFSLLIAVPIFGWLQQVLVEGHIHRDTESAARLVGIALTIGALCFSSEREQKVFAIIGIVFVAAYVLGLFFQLPPPALTSL
jgi:hypothetical protein